MKAAIMRVPKTEITLYHYTDEDAGHAILTSGFKDGTGYYGTGHLHTGVWLSDVPMDAVAGFFPAHFDVRSAVLLEVRLKISARTLRSYEWIEEGKPYREFLIPARIVNAHGVVRKVEDDDDTLPDRFGVRP